MWRGGRVRTESVCGHHDPVFVLDREHTRSGNYRLPLHRKDEQVDSSTVDHNGSS